MAPLALKRGAGLSSQDRGAIQSSSSRPGRKAGPFRVCLPDSAMKCPETAGRRLGFSKFTITISDISLPPPASGPEWRFRRSVGGSVTVMVARSPCGSMVTYATGTAWYPRSGFISSRSSLPNHAISLVTLSVPAIRSSTSSTFGSLSFRCPQRLRMSARRWTSRHIGTS